MKTAMPLPSWSWWSWIGVGVLVCLAAAFTDRALFVPAFYFALLLWISVALGALASLMVHHLTGGRWGFMVRRIFEATTLTFPVLGVLFFLFFLTTDVLREGTGYFAPGWIALRSLLNFAIWIALAWMLRKRSLQQDRSEDLVFTKEMRAISGPGLVVYFLTVSFAMVDWVMVLIPGWRSTMFPGIMIATQTLLALAGAVAVFPVLAKAPEIMEVATARAWHDLGKLLFAFVIFWAYVAFSQFLIIWSGNLPLETLWYRQRSEGGWHALALAIGVVCFFAPAVVLLFQAPKRAPKTLATVAAGIWISQAVFLFWVVMPSFFPVIHLGWRDIVMPLAVGAIWAAFFNREWQAAPPVPLHDPRMNELELAHS